MIAVTKPDEIAALMYRNGFTQRQLAKTAGIGVVTANQVCGGKRNPSPPVAKKIADALGVEFNEIFELVPRNADGKGA